jgi:xanthine/uracil permease
MAVKFEIQHFSWPLNLNYGTVCCAPTFIFHNKVRTKRVNEMSVVFAIIAGLVVALEMEEICVRSSQKSRLCTVSLFACFAVSVRGLGCHSATGGLMAHGRSNHPKEESSL